MTLISDSDRENHDLLLTWQTASRTGFSLGYYGVCSDFQRLTTVGNWSLKTKGCKRNPISCALKYKPWPPTSSKLSLSQSCILCGWSCLAQHQVLMLFCSTPLHNCQSCLWNCEWASDQWALFHHHVCMHLHWVMWLKTKVRIIWMHLVSFLKILEIMPVQDCQ